MKYTNQSFLFKIFLFIFFKFKDMIHFLKHGREFDEYGVTIYCGRQGAGKTISMTEYLERMRKKFPNVLIYTNYNYINQDGHFTDWKDFFNIRNGENGVIFAIDEIQNEFSSAAWRNFPESLLTEITQQRKQRIKIVCTSQIYSRVAKQLREQCSDVVECKTFLGRWTFERCYDAVDYNKVIDRPEAKDKIRKLYSKSYVQDAYIRSLFDTYEKIERMKRTPFMSKQERGV